MKVFKFGGASVKNADAVRNLAEIVKEHIGYELVIVVSAMDKMTNALEKLTSDFYFNDGDLNVLIQTVKQFHDDIAEDLFPEVTHEIHKELENVYERIKTKCLKYKRAEANYDFIYDQVVSEGEILATLIVDHYLNDIGIYSIWLDARKLIHTDNNYREAAIDWEKTEDSLRSKITFQENCVYVIQGFIGHYNEDQATTLGREGSDFTAAVVGNVMDAVEVVIWKDVPGLLNADPKYFKNTIQLNNISYHESVELAYYGATVIHPKTIKPLQNKSIPLYVKSFKEATQAGSVINENSAEDSLIPSYIFKQDQVLFSVFTRDYSFVTEQNLSEIFNLFARFGIKINLMENSAISFTTCFQNEARKVEKLTNALSEKYKVLYNEGVELMTIRHYDQATLDQLTLDREILVEQKSRHTARLVMKKV